MLYLLVHRLPAVEPLERPEINLPRVTRIEMLDSERSAPQPEDKESRCFMIGGFLTWTGARNWLLLRGLPLSEHRIIRHGAVERSVLSVHGPARDRFPPMPSTESTALEPFSLLAEAEGALNREFLFSDSGSLALSSIYRIENKRGLTLESDRVSFYSYALVGDEGLREAWSQRFSGGYSGNLVPESCQGIAKQGQNP
ncbi:hypothetical protein [Halospina denitrificans]|nr:hypothetical protein [Halospina denitrificans]